MPTTYNYKPLLHKKQWDLCAAPTSVVASSGLCGVKSRIFDQFYYLLRSNASLEVYDPFQDAWGAMATPGLSTFGAGACIEFMPMGPSGTATGGSTTTLNTNLTIPIDLRGYQIRITGGPGAGDVRTILSNTLGANSVITVASGTPFSTSITASSTFTLVTGRLYMFGSGTLASGSFRMFDFATQVFSSLSITGLPATFTSDGCLVGTPSIVDLGNVTSFATGTATAGGASTITNAGKNWATNQWANAYQVRITAGTGAGQVRRIASNTATVITVTSAWTTQPDATSVYSIEGDDDSLYLLGSNAITAYRYSISSNTWATLSPGVARGGSLSIGGCARWISDATASDWTNENAIINGRRIYSFRGSVSTALDYYDIAANTWVNGLAYGPVTISPTSSWKYADNAGRILIRNASSGTSTGYWYVYDCATNTLKPWNNITLFGNSNNVGNTPFIATYSDGATRVPFLYAFVEHSSFSGLMRCLAS